MTSSGAGGPLTALDVLFGPEADIPAALAREILSASDQNLGRALGGLPEVTREAAVREAATVAAGLLQVDLISVLVAGWREHRDISSVARRTLAAPGSAELVSMITHRVTVAQNPSVSVLVDGHRVATVQLGLSITFDVNALLAGISGGRLVTIHSGRCDITATLAVQDTDLLTKQAHLELPGAISVRDQGSGSCPSVNIRPASTPPANTGGATTRPKATRRRHRRSPGGSARQRRAGMGTRKYQQLDTGRTPRPCLPGAMPRPRRPVGSGLQAILGDGSNIRR